MRWRRERLRKNPTRGRQLAIRNEVLVSATQAALGLIGPDMRAFYVELEGQRAVFHFAVANVTADVEDDIEEILFSFEALVAETTMKSLDVRVHPSSEVESGGRPLPGFGIYEAKPPRATSVHEIATT